MRNEHETHAAAIRQVEATGLTGLIQLVGLIEVRTMVGAPRRHTDNLPGNGEHDRGRGRDREALRYLVNRANKPPPRAWCTAPPRTRICARVEYVLGHFEQDMHSADKRSRNAACSFPSR